MDFQEINEEVLYTTEKITKVDSKDINLLKSKASKNKRKRVRLCAHENTDDALHEMLIVHSRGAYVRPHKHTSKSESFHVIEGSLKVVIFSESGDVSEVVKMGEFMSPKVFFYRVSQGYFHTVIPESETVVFHETTNGPFNRNDTSFAEWAPDENMAKECNNYLIKLYEQIKLY